MRIGQLADQVDVDAATIRFYEAEGVLPDPQRLPSGYRDYDPEDIARVRFVKQARSLGLTLDDIRQILALRDRGETPCSHVRSLIDRQAEMIDRRIKELEQAKRELRRLAGVAASLPATELDQPCVCHIIEAAEVTNPRRGTGAVPRSITP